jgi:PAS domain S-box-containing protein
MQAAYTKALREVSMFESEHRVIRPDGSQRWVLSRARPDLDNHGSIVRYLGTTQDITERKVAELALSSNEERLRLALSAGHMGIWDWDLRSGQVLWNDEEYKILGYSRGSIEPSYEAWLARVYPEDRPSIRSHVEDKVRTGGDYRLEYRLLGQGEAVKWVETHGRVDVDARGTAYRSYGVEIDVTERKQAEEHRLLLLKEVNHRAKNLLNVVQSIAQLTSADVTTENFFQTFASRLQGLASCHDLLVNAEWKGVDMCDLIRSQLSHFRALIGVRILLEGPAITLNPAASQAIGMAIHELATNAAKYGALSVDNGIVRVNWSVRSKEDVEQPSFTAEWKEERGPPVAGQLRKGFGYTVLVEMPEHLLQASVTLDFDRDGVAWRMTAPMQNVGIQ